MLRLRRLRKCGRRLWDRLRRRHRRLHCIRGLIPSIQHRISWNEEHTYELRTSSTKPTERSDSTGETSEYSRLFLLSTCFRGRQTGQSVRLQCFQCEIICLEEEQCATLQFLPTWQEAMCFSIFFIVLQCGNAHCWKEEKIETTSTNETQLR